MRYFQVYDGYTGNFRLVTSGNERKAHKWDADFGLAVLTNMPDGSVREEFWSETCKEWYIEAAIDKALKRSA